MTESGDLEFNGLRVLVVEDDFDVAESLTMMLSALGCEVIGPAATSDEARELIKQQELDAALLDIALSPGTSAPVARSLSYKRCPFAFVTGFGNIEMLPADLRGHRVLLKPVDLETLSSTMHELAGDR